MHLVTFERDHQPGIGLEVGGRIVDLKAGFIALRGGTSSAKQEADFLFPPSMVEFLSRGEVSLNPAREVDEASKEGRQVLMEPPASWAFHEVRLLAPVLNPHKIICIGLNYRDHCEENNQPIPEKPIIFAKFPNAITGPDSSILLPRISKKVDYEAELAVIIGKKGKRIPEDKALEYVAGYTCANDVSARDLQFGDGQWVRGKTLDTFLPLGPYLVTPEEIPDPHHLAIRCTVNGQVLQDSNTRHLIFNIPKLIAFISQAITLQPGDLISTGTPAGVGAFRKPPIFLKPGDKVTVSIERIGDLTNWVMEEAS